MAQPSNETIVVYIARLQKAMSSKNGTLARGNGCSGAAALSKPIIFENGIDQRDFCLWNWQQENQYVLDGDRLKVRVLLQLEYTLLLQYTI